MTRTPMRVGTMKVAVLALVIVLAVFHPAVVMAQTSAGDRVKTEAEDNETLRRAREDRLANSRRVVQEFAARVKEASDVFAGLQSEVQKFQSRLDKLQTDDDGKRLARDNPAVMHIMDLQKAPPVVESQVVAKKGFLDGLLKALNEELNRPNVGYIPPTERKEDVERAVLWATDRLGTIRAEQGIHLLIRLTNRTSQA